MSARRVGRYVAEVRILALDYTVHPSRHYELFRGPVKVKHGLSSKQAFAVLAEAVTAAWESGEALPVGAVVEGQMLLPFPDSAPPEET